MENADIKYLKVLATQYPNIAAAATEIVNLKAILSLPKATEHFITDVHGEYEQFRHVMCNGSGAVQRKIEDEFGSSLGIPEKRTLASSSARLTIYMAICFPVMSVICSLRSFIIRS